jgi:hypothetical protein
MGIGSVVCVCVCVCTFVVRTSCILPPPRMGDDDDDHGKWAGLYGSTVSDNVEEEEKGKGGTATLGVPVFLEV